MNKIGHVFLPVDDTASIVMEPSSGQSGTPLALRTHAGLCHCPTLASSFPFSTNNNRQNHSIKTKLSSFNLGLFNPSKNQQNLKLAQKKGSSTIKIQWGKTEGNDGYIWILEETQI